MRILTFGWEFPPMRNGGLGVACHGLTEELIDSGVEVVFVLPKSQPTVGKNTFIFADKTPAKTYVVESAVMPYKHAHSFYQYFTEEGEKVRISREIIQEVYRYAEAARKIAENEHFDAIHAHDWTSYLAGLAAKIVSGKPLVLHVHATSFDQSGGNYVDPDMYAVEHKSFHGADSIVTVSQFTKDTVIEKYGIDPEKVTVIHNGVKLDSPKDLPPVLTELKEKGKKIVFYNGRITIQKGVDYFIHSARKVVDIDPDVIFVISGWGDMEHQIMHLVGSLGLSKNVIFAGSLWDDERDSMYQAADLLVMPSVSEPFGLVPLEAIHQGTPVLISKQSGVSEVLKSALKVDFWDVEEMTNKIVAALKYPALNRQLVHEGRGELFHLSWKNAAVKVVALYRKLIDWWNNRG